MRLKLTDSNDPEFSRIINVDYSGDHKHHSFTSKDFPGLFVSTMDMDKSLELLAPSIMSLHWHNDKRIITVSFYVPMKDENEQQVG